MQLSITHSSEYQYTHPVAYGLLRIRLKPKPTHGQEIQRWSMELTGAKVETEYEDQHSMPIWAFEKQTDLTRPSAQIRQLAASLSSDPANYLDTLHELSAAILDAVTYEVGQTDAATTAADAVAAGKGVCQDHAHIFISAARHLGIPAAEAT